MQNIENEDRQAKELEILDIIIHCWKNKFLIIASTVIFTAFGALYSLSITNIYQTQSLLIEANDSSNQHSSVNAVMNAAGLNTESGTLNDGHIAEEIIQTREFLAHLLKFPGVWPALMATEGYDPTSKKIIFDENIYNLEDQDWVGGKEGAPTFLATYKEYRRNVLGLKYDRSMGFLRLSVSHMSPEFSKEFADLIIKEVNETMRLHDLKKTNEYLDYLTKELETTKYMEVKSAMNNILEGQLIKKMESMISKEYILRVLAAPFLPEERISPWRSGISMFFALLGVVLSTSFVIVREYLLPTLLKR